MTAIRVPLFCDIALARRIERAETELMAASSEAARRRGAKPEGFVIQVSGGVASFAGAGSPYNKVAGLGFGGVPAEDELDEIERRYATRGASVQVELSNLADPEIGAQLSARGYRLVSFENVLGLAITEPHERITPPGVEVRRSGDEEFDLWLDVVTDGFAHGDDQGVPSHEDFPREVMDKAQRDFAAAGVRRYIALRDGIAAGGASVGMTDGIAQMAGAATAPAHRHRGIQTALLAARLADAAAEGCDIAVVTTQPGSVSQRNVQRSGFDLLYTRAILVKQS
ncbi:MAG: GNAT family N-acetyltransferase [Streptosporangiaceae bacterium]